MALNPKLMRRLLDTFKIDLAEQTETISEHLLALEAGVADDAAAEHYANLMRASHNLKGAARGMGLKEIETAAHSMEQRFSELRDLGQARLPKPAVDIFLSIMEGAREWVIARIDEREPERELDSSIHALEATSVADWRGSSTQDEPSQGEVAPSSEPDASAAIAGPAEPVSASADAVPEDDDDHPVAEVAPSSEQIRVDVDRLDILKNQAEDLIVNQVHLMEHGTELGRLRAAIANAARAGRSGSTEAMLSDLSQLERRVSRLHLALRGSLKSMERTSAALDHELKMLRLTSIASILNPLLRSARLISRDLGKQVELRVEHDDIRVDRMVLDRLRDPLVHVVRNALDHGIEAPADRRAAGKPESGTLSISVERVGNMVEVHVADDGAGIDPEKIVAKAAEGGVIPAEAANTMSREEKLRLVFSAGFSSRETVTDLSGRGFGLDIVQTELQAFKGSVRLESETGVGTTLTLRVPLTLGTERGLEVRIGDQFYVIPTIAVDHVLSVKPSQLYQLEADTVVQLDGIPVPVRALGATLGGSGSVDEREGGEIKLVVMARGGRRVALEVDDIVNEREIVIKPLRPPLVSVRNVAGASFDESGKVVMVLDPTTLVDSALRRTDIRPVRVAESEAPPPRILVVDDSLTTRILEKNILESQGYLVEVRVNGREALETLRHDNEFDLLISDIEMPEMNGFELTEAVRADPELADIPIIIVSSLESQEHRQRGLELGANAYIVKGEFETRALLTAVGRLI